MGSGANKSLNAAEIDRLALEVATSPGSKAFLPLAEEYGKAGMWDEAAGVLEDGLKLNPQFITAMVALGRAYDQLNQPVKAVAILEEAVKLSPENLRAHRTLAKIYTAQGAKEAALQSCRAILAANHQDQEALALCAKLQPPAVGDSPAPSNVAAATVVPPVEVSVGTVDHQAAAAEIPLLVQGTPVGVNAEAGFSPKERADVAQLRRWLGNIELNRRDRNPPAD
ncbi:MAG: tetratricopeptide repeat protein [Nitrospira sp.]|nr:tetratricopeptide repeat protein [Nitrospira sp.]